MSSAGRSLTKHSLRSVFRALSAGSASSLQQESIPRRYWFGDDQVEHFQQFGYVKASPNFLSDQEKEDAIRWAAELGNLPLTKGEK